MIGKLLSEKQMVLAMIVEAQNELTKCKIVERLQNRELLTRISDSQGKQLLMMNKKRIDQLKQTIFNLFDFYKTADDATPLAKELKLDNTKDS